MANYGAGVYHQLDSDAFNQLAAEDDRVEIPNQADGAAEANRNNNASNDSPRPFYRPKTADQQTMSRIYGVQSSTEFESKHKSFKSVRFFRGGTH